MIFSRCIKLTLLLPTKRAKTQFLIGLREEKQEQQQHSTSGIFHTQLHCFQFSFYELKKNHLQSCSKVSDPSIKLCCFCCGTLTFYFLQHCFSSLRFLDIHLYRALLQSCHSISIEFDVLTLTRSFNFFILI